MNIETLANMSMEQIGAMSEEELEKLGLDGDKEDVESASSGADAVDQDSVVQQATDSKEPSEEPAFVEAKNGKAKIPYKVLEDTRAEVASLKDELARMREQSGRTIYQAEITPEHKEQLTAVEGELSGLHRKFEDGDLEWEEYQTQLNDAIGRRDILSRQVLKAEISAEISQQSAKQAWDDTVSTFMSKAQSGIDYSQDEAKRNDLDMFIKLLGNDPSNAEKTYDWFLDTAHTAVMAKHGVVPSAAKQDQRQVEKTAPDEQVKKPPFNSLSDIPGGSPPAKNEMEQLGDLSTAAIANKFLKDPAAIDKYLAQLR